MRRIGGLFGVTVSLGGCGVTDPVCTDEARPALGVLAQDSVSGAFVVGAAVLAHDGSYRDSVLTRTQDGYAFLANGRPGRYEVDVRHEQYQDWNATAVEVAADECGPLMVTLVAKMQQR